ncbi:MAG: cytochrome c3 family protein [Desulfuromonadales bacterium]|nr:cytochrome c3 family protein [Desulfuromonadales bacterium]
MKRLFIMACLVAAGMIAIVMALGSKNRLESAEKKPSLRTAQIRNGGQIQDSIIPPPEDKMAVRMPEHAQSFTTKKVNCKMCHDCEYPTRQKPCLMKCPKTESSIYHSPSEAPEVLLLDELTDRYGSVVFSHRLHAQMSEMGSGCNGCHHYNTTGPVLNCKKCHERSKNRENIAVPDLSSAYHRQCLPCHRQWGRSTACDSCHIPKDTNGTKKLRQATQRLKGKNHPQLPKPNKIVYETRYDRGGYVTFYHDEHVTVFKQTCVICHKGDNCIKCHDVQKVTQEEPVDGRHLKVHKSFQEHHRACTACHENDACSTCHGSSEKSRFSHAISTGWNLKSYHARLPCQRCHEVRTSFNKPDRNCRSCHKGWKKGTFKHKITGLELSANHIDLECENCHKGGDYSIKPDCKECHNDKEFPKALPGKRTSKK